MFRIVTLSYYVKLLVLVGVPFENERDHLLSRYSAYAEVRNRSLKIWPRLVFHVTAPFIWVRRAKCCALFVTVGRAVAHLRISHSTLAPIIHDLAQAVPVAACSQLRLSAAGVARNFPPCLVTGTSTQKLAGWRMGAKRGWKAHSRARCQAPRYRREHCSQLNLFS